MDFHVYRNSQDRWHDLRPAARSRGAVLASNAVTLEELVRRLTPEVDEATRGQRLALVSLAVGDAVPIRYALDALDESKGAGVEPGQLRQAGALAFAGYLEEYNRLLEKNGLTDPQDRRWLAAGAVKNSQWLARFERVTLHALYDPNPAESELLHNLIARLPDGGTVELFNATANIKPTRFAEWTWQGFVRDEALADKAFPEFVRSSGPAKDLLERLFIFDAASSERLREPMDALRIFQCAGRYSEVQTIGAAVGGLLDEGAEPSEIAVIIRHIDLYGEMIEDVFSRYGIACIFETGVPLLRIPFIKYWLAVLDLASGDRPREALARVLASAYHEPRIVAPADPEGMLAGIGYMDRRHLKASALAVRHASVLAAHLERFELFLDEIEQMTATPREFLERLPAPASLTERDLEAWRTLCEEIDAIDRLMGPVSLTQFRQLMSEVCGMRTIGRSSKMAMPGSAAVRVIPPSALGYRSYRWVFAAGFADGEIPAPTPSNPLLPDDLIDALNRQVRPRRLQNSRDRNRKEPLFLFLMLDSATDQITLTWPGSTLEGETILSSIYIGEIERHYEEKLAAQPPATSPRDRGESLRAIASAWREDRIDDFQALDLLGKDVIRRVQWQKMGAERGDLGAGVLATDVIFSPSELNTLSDCPFIFLARHRLKIRPKDLPDFEVSPLEIGSFAHQILAVFYATPVGVSEEQAVSRMKEVIERQLAEVDIHGQGQRSVIDPSLWKIRRPQLVRALLEYAKFAVRDARDGYETLPEYLDQYLPAATLGRAQLSGRPDRVAVRHTEGRLTGIRIDDFKYSSASADTTRQLRQSFQIPVYAHLAARKLSADPGVPIEGRYLLLRSPSSPVVSQPVDTVFLAEVAQRIDDLMELIHAGRLHPEPSDREGCKSCDYRRLCRLYGD
jgi:RecB family exonuclease